MNNGFSHGGREFKLNKLDAMKQFHIVRRIGPILSELFPAMKEAAQLNADSKGQGAETNLEQIAKLATPVMMGLSKLSDEDSEIVLYGLLGAVEVKQAAGNWARVASGSLLMMQDLQLPDLLQLAGRSLMFNLGSFFLAAPR